MLRSDDGGASWTEVAANIAANRLNNVDFFDRTHGWATELFPGSIFHTTDGGLTWEDQGAGIALASTATGSFNPNAVVALSRTSAIAVGGEFFGFGSFGLIFRTDDGGRRWARVPISPSPELLSDADLLDVCVGPAGVGIAAGFEIEVGQTVAVTKDNGQTWSDVTARTQAGGPIAVACAGEQDLWMISRGGFGAPGRQLSHSPDGGATWTTREDALPTGVRLFSLTFVTAALGWAVGLDGIDSPVVLHTRDGGASWSIQMQSLAILRSIVFPTPLVGFVGWSGVFATADGGASYVPGTLPAEAGNVAGLAVIVTEP